MTVSVLCFGCGPLRMAIAAGNIAGIAPSAAGQVLLADVLGLQSSNRPQKTVKISCNHNIFPVVVDEPIEFVELDRSQIIPSASVKSGRVSGVMGFAKIEDDLIFLMDINQLASELRPPPRPEEAEL